MYVYIFMRCSFGKHDLQTWNWHCKPDYGIGAYRALEKSSSYSLLSSVFIVVLSLLISMSSDIGHQALVIMTGTPLLSHRLLFF